MRASECYVGMKLKLQMEWVEVDKATHRRQADTATCIYIPANKSYGLFQFRNGLKQTVPLEDDSRLACNVKDKPPAIPPELVHQERGESISGNNAKLDVELKKANVTKAAVSRQGGRSSSYITSIMRDREMTNAELDYWVKKIWEVEAENRNPVDEHDPYYTIKKALRECDLSAPKASVLCGHSKSWLRGLMSRPLDDGRQLEIATMIRKQAARAREEDVTK